MITLLLVLMFAGGVNAWWNNQWQYRKKINLDATPAGADIKGNLSEISLLIRLHPGNFNFSNTKVNGEDIRFVSADDQTPLKHHIEVFDTLDEVGLLWVKVPRLSGGGNQDFMWMYYGNDSAVGGQDARSTYDVQQLAVYHFGESEGGPKDQTAYEHHITDFKAGQGLPSVMGKGITFSGAGDRLIIPASPAFDFKDGVTVSAWVRITGPLDDAYLFSRENEKGSIVVGVDQTKVYCRITKRLGDKVESVETEKTTDLSINTWHHVSVTIDPKKRVSIYLDGIEMNWREFSSDMPEVEGDIAIGGSAKEGHSFTGDMDELQLSKSARSADWIRAAYRSQGPEAKLLSFGVEEVGESSGGLPLFYLAVVFKNITIDGWVIIGILMLMAATSWMVFLSKALFLWLAQKDNRVFMSSFIEIKDVLALDTGDDEFRNSSLYRIYRSGCQELRKFAGNPNPSMEARALTPKEMNSFKASLDKGYIEENQRLNGWLIFLTMAITGGPFLGLLGTVWGVMNTFAAMAEAGEANIMAIAPGVASALSTTVFGLIVAIPALFSYNYLATRVKNLTADMTIFVDQFILRAEEMEGEEAQ
jgi:biopolymer transport protein ExbB